MKKLIFAIALVSLALPAAFAQTPTPPSRPATNTAAPSAAPGGGTGAEGKVAYINTGQFRQGIQEMKIRFDALNTEFEPKWKEVQAAEEEVNNLKNKVQTQGSTVSPQVRNQWVEEGAEKEKRMTRLREDYTALGQKRMVDVSQPVYEKVNKFLEQYCQTRGIVLVIEGGAAQQAGILLYATPASDITDDFMKEYNKVHPAGAAPVPAAAKKP